MPKDMAAVPRVTACPVVPCHHREPSTMGGYVLAIAKALQSCGVDNDDLLMIPPGTDRGVA
jgi:hypothetical protein